MFSLCFEAKFEKELPLIVSQEDYEKTSLNRQDNTYIILTFKKQSKFENYIMLANSFNIPYTFL